MELLRTDCSIVIDPNTDALHLIKFVGEGGESIEVRLAAAGTDVVDTDTQLVAKAAATMVQVAAFLVNEETSPGAADPTSRPGLQHGENPGAPDKPVPQGPGPSPRPDPDTPPKPPVFPG
jgi:hypothetical protein